MKRSDSNPNFREWHRLVRPSLIRRYIKMGSSPYIDEPDKIPHIQRMRYLDLDRVGPQGWEMISEGLETDELVALIKGLTVAEVYNHWTCISVSPVIFTFRELTKRDKALSKQLCSWVNARMDNPYFPSTDYFD